VTLDLRATLRLDARFTLDATLTAGPGVTWILGPSGAGKTTLLRVVAGLARPDAGHIRFGATTWFAEGTWLPPEARTVGFVPQSLGLFPHLGVRANIAYGAGPTGERAVLAAAARFRASHLLERRPATLSGGEAQRVAIARAVARRPTVLLLDEPFSALDEELAGDLAREIADYASEAGVVTLCVSHRRGAHEGLPGPRWVMRAGLLQTSAPAGPSPPAAPP
jgi:molybdate transport system ATP-binding protein